MPRFEFKVWVDTDTEEHATTVVNERIGHDEDYGFGYQVDWSGPAQQGMRLTVAPSAQEEYAAADADHKPVPDERGDHYECHHQPGGPETYCGLATLADRSRHGHID